MNLYYRAVLHIVSPRQFKKIHTLASKVIDMVSINNSVYITPKPTMADLKTANDLLEQYITEASSRDHTKILKRNAQSLVVLDLLRVLVKYVNDIAKGDKYLVSLSGYDVNEENEPLPVPAQPLLKRLEKGSEENTVKAFIEPDKNAKIYKLEVTETPDDEKSWRSIADTTNSKKLIARNVPKDKKLYYRISAGNSAGWSLHSVVLAYYLV